MAITLATLSGTVADLVGDVVLDDNTTNPNRRVKIVVDSNAPSDYIADLANDVMRLGTATTTPAADGTWSFADLIATGSADTNLDDSANLQYTVRVDYPRASDRKRVQETFGPFALTTTSDITDLVAEQALDLSYASEFMTQAQALLDAQIALSGIDDTDSAIAAIVDDPVTLGPLTGVALSAAIAGVTDPIDARVETLESSIGGPDVGEGFVSKLDVKASTAVIAILGDSTWYKNGSSLYIGTDGFEVPRKIAEWIKTNYPTAEIGYHLLSSWATYAAEVVVDDGTTVATVISDDFSGTAGALLGTTPDTGTAWTGAGFNLDGSGNAQQIANTSTTAGATQAGRLKTTWIYENVPVASGYVWLLGAFISSSNFLAMRDNSADTIDCQVVVAGVTTTPKTFTYAEAGISASVTADVTASIEHKADGTVVYTIGSATYTHTLAAGHDDVFKVAARAGMSGTRSGYLMRSIQTEVTAPADTVVDVYNGAFSSKNVVDSKNSYATLVPVTPDVVIVAHGHNQTTDTPAAFETKLDDLVTVIRTAHPSAAIVIASQNPEPSGATNYVAHAARQADLRRYARSKGFGYIPVYEAFQALTNPLSLVIGGSDVHPTPAGVDLIGDTAVAYLDALSLRPA